MIKAKSRSKILFGVDTPSDYHPAQDELAQELAKLAHGGLWNFAAILSTKILPNILVLILALLISAEELGVYSFIISTYTILSLIADLGIAYSLQKTIQESPSRAASISTTSFVVRFLSSAVLGLFAVLLDRKWHIFQDQSPLIVLLLISSSFGIFVYVLNAHMQYRQTSLLMILRNLISFVLSLLLVVLGIRISGPIISLSLAYLFTGLLTILLAKAYFKPDIDWALARKIIHIGFFMTIASTLNILTQQTGILALAYYSSNESVGIYKVAMTIGMIPMLLGDGIILPLLPLIKKFIHAGSQHTINIIILIMRYLIIGGLLLLLTASIVSKPLFHFLYNTRYDASIWPLRILLVAGLLGMLYIVLISVLLMSDMVKRASLICFVVSVTCAALNAVAVPRYRMAGAAASLVIAFLLGLILVVISSEAYFKMRFEWKRYLVYLLSFGEIASLYSLFLINELRPVAQIFFGIILAPILVITAVYIQKGISKRELRRILELAKITYRGIFAS